jgi:hypothetical protein
MFSSLEMEAPQHTFIGLGFIVLHKRMGTRKQIPLDMKRFKKITSVISEDIRFDDDQILYFGLDFLHFSAANLR